MRAARARRRRRLAVAGLTVLLALTAFAWWLSGRWLARPELEPAPGAPRAVPSPPPRR
ncbi:MAG TPA: hypothetical protein VLT61_05525 [Anaeromyxobacteraceae bacterium]|nr:hypothetical protein [Anaeromyxobacteraceae bacterium]